MGSPVVHFEINGPDDELIAKYYSELFGWHVQPVPGMEYATIDTHACAGINGGITANPMKEPGIAIWAESQDLQKYLDRAVELGGTEMMPPTKVNDEITIAIFMDPQRTVTGVYIHQN